MVIKQLTYVVASFLLSIPLSFPPDLCCFVVQWLPRAAIDAAPHPVHWPLQHRSERETPLAAGHGSLGTASRTESVGTCRSVPMGPGGSAPPLWGAGLLLIWSGLVWRWKCWACATIQSPEHSLTLNETLWRHTKQPWTPGGQNTQRGYLNLNSGHKLLQVCFAWRDNSPSILNAVWWVGLFYLKGEVYIAEVPLSSGGCSGELSTQSWKHRHLYQIQSTLHHILFRENIGVPLQHVKCQLSYFYQL